ncbi:MAG: DUF427 domain-containing protein [Actinomycetota bacterium]|nr:DUF427 domain-containing protein [Actinomycetota bacterium]
MTPKTRRRDPIAGSAWFSGHRIAVSNDVLVLEGFAYFPLEDVADGVLRRSRFKSLCYWKGIASYFHVLGGDEVARNSAWTYRHPSPIARRIKNRVAFWHDIEVRLDR